MLRLLLIGLIAVPILEIAVLIKVGQSVGALPVVGLLLLAAVFGLLVIRSRGFALAQNVRATLRQGQLPAVPLADAALVAFAGALLILPGFLSDIVAVALLLPPVRLALYGWAARHLARFAPSQSRPAPRQVIDLSGDDWRQR